MELKHRSVSQSVSLNALSTACCYLVSTREAVFIGLISGLLTFLVMKLIERQYVVDDPTASFAVHGVGGMWGMIAAGVFVKADERIAGAEHDGLMRGGGAYLILVQLAAVLSLTAWSAITTYAILWISDHIIPIRMDLVNELLGTDYASFNVLRSGLGIEEALEVLKHYHDNVDAGIDPTGQNLGTVELILL